MKLVSRENTTVQRDLLVAATHVADARCACAAAHNLSFVKRRCAKYPCMLIRELLISNSNPVGGAIPGPDPQSEGACDIAEADDLGRLARCCAAYFQRIEREHRRGRHISNPNSEPKSVGRVKEGGVPKNAKPPAVARPRKLKSGPNVVKPKKSVAPPKPIKSL